MKFRKFLSSMDKSLMSEKAIRNAFKYMPHLHYFYGISLNWSFPLNWSLMFQTKKSIS